MKLYKSILVATALVGAMLTSCSDSGYWEGASSADLGQGATYSFSNKTLSYTFEGTETLKGTDVIVTITRGTTSGTATVPVKAEFSDAIMMSAPSEVTFADGSNTAAYPIHFNEELVPGEKQMARLTLDTLKLGFEQVEEPAPLSKNSTHEDSVAFDKQSVAYATYMKKLENYKLQTTITFLKNLTWVSAGSCLFVDFTVSENGDQASNVPIMNGAGTNMYRIVTPWKYAFGSDCSASTDIEFTLDENYAMTLTTDGTSTGVVGEFTHATEGTLTFCMPTRYMSYCTVTSEGNLYQASMLGLVNGEGYYRGFQFAFQWTEGWPGNK